MTYPRLCFMCLSLFVGSSNFCLGSQNTPEEFFAAHRKKMSKINDPFDDLKPNIRTVAAAIGDFVFDGPVPGKAADV